MGNRPCLELCLPQRLEPRAQAQPGDWHRRVARQPKGLPAGKTDQKVLDSNPTPLYGTVLHQSRDQAVVASLSAHSSVCKGKFYSKARNHGSRDETQKPRQSNSTLQNRNDAGGIFKEELSTKTQTIQFHSLYDMNHDKTSTLKPQVHKSTIQTMSECLAEMEDSTMNQWCHRRLASKAAVTHPDSKQKSI